jgi:hypothetical protein
MDNQLLQKVYISCNWIDQETNIWRKKDYHDGTNVLMGCLLINPQDEISFKLSFVVDTTNIKPW